MKLERKHGMILLLILMLSSSLTAFMNKPITTNNAELVVKFSDYELYELSIDISDNTTMLQAISGYYHVRLENESLKCIRNSCNNDNGTWLAFTDRGLLINNPSGRVVDPGEKLYMIYNQTSTSDYEKDVEAIKDLLQITS